MTFRACIVTTRYFHQHETMINFHIKQLFGGDTVVACERFLGENPYSKAVHPLRARGGVFDWLARPFRKVRAFRTHATRRILLGPEGPGFIRFLRDQRVDVVVSEFGTRAVTIAPALEEAGIPHFAYFRGYDAARVLRDPDACEAYRRMMPRLDGIVAVSSFLLDNLRQVGATHPNAHVIPSGVDTDRFRSTEKQTGTFLAVGRFVEKKRPDITIRAFAAVAAIRKNLHLDMVGDGPMLDDCRKLAAELGLGDTITFHGALPHKDVAERMARTRVFLQHSMTASSGDAEGVPIAIQEAMACGMVVISTRHAGIPEIVSHGATGFLVDEGDEIAYAEAIDRVARDEGRLVAVASAARAYAVAELDKRLLTRRFEGVLSDAVHRRRSGP